MSKQSKNTIKNWFKNGAFPNQFHFWDWMDSFFHKDEQIPASQIDQLQDLLDAKVDRKDLPDGEMAMDDISGLNSALNTKMDKEDGKGLSAEDFSSNLKTKLDGLEEGANKYEHPLTHPANLIEETADKTFTSEDEKLANANHIANKDIHKSSEQIRSEIVDGNIPASIARQSDVAASADGVLSSIRGGVSETYDTLKKVYDWIFVHDGNTDIHKTSEQIRSEIVDEDIPASIARVTDISYPNLQEVTESAAITDVYTTFKGGLGTGVNTRLGASSAQNTTGGSSWTSIGSSAGTSSIAASHWTAVGAQAGGRNTTGSQWTAVGSGAGVANIAGNAWTAIGNAAAESSTTGQQFVALGYHAGQENISGDSWTALGTHASRNNTDGYGFVSIGASANHNGTNSTYFVTIGSNSSYSNITGRQFVSVGNDSARHASSGDGYVAIGHEAGMYYGTSNVTSINNSVLIGKKVKPGSTTPNNEIVIGADATGRGDNTVTLGNNATTNTYLHGKLHVDNQIKIGSSSTVGYVLTAADTTGNATWQPAGGGGSTALQEVTEAGASSDQLITLTGGLTSRRTSENSERFGLNALISETPGTTKHSSAFGDSAMRSNISGLQNSAFGREALNKNTTGSFNSAFGYRSLYSNVGGSYNTAMGVAAMQNVTSGSRNIGIGVTALGTLNNGLDNIAIGHEASFDSTSSSRNIAIGTRASANNTTGSSNVAIGYESLTTQTNASGNVGVGFETLKMATGGNNTAVGTSASTNNTTGASNTAIGNYALRDSTTGGFNTAVGAYCMPSSTSSIGRNTAMGYGALQNNVSGHSMVAVGHSALISTTGGSYAVGIGRNAGANTTDGNNVTFIGGYAGADSTSANNATAVGYSAGRYETGTNNTYVGMYAGAASSGDHGTFSNITALGYQSRPTANDQVVLGNNRIASVISEGSFVSNHFSPLGSSPAGVDATAGHVLTAIGDGTSRWQAVSGGATPSLQHVTSVGASSGSHITLTGGIRSNPSNAASNERFGKDAMNSAISGSIFNTAVGQFSLRDLTTGDGNTAVGHNSALNLISGVNNTAMGYLALESVTTAGNNVAVGAAALKNCSSSNNAAIGYGALGRMTTGTGNTAIGYISGDNQRGTNCTFLGFRAGRGGDSNVRTFTNSTAVGADSTITSHNQIVLGDAGVNEVFSHGTFNSRDVSPLGSAPSGVNAADGMVLTANGSGGSSWQAAGGGSSPTLQGVTDAGNSTTNNIVTTGTVTASNFILSSDERLKTFKDEPIVDVNSIDIKKFNYNNDENKRDRYGVSAQELQKVAPEMVYEDTDEDKTLRVGYIDFLLAKCENQDKEIAELKVMMFKLMEDK